MVDRNEEQKRAELVRQVAAFHQNSDLDYSTESQHHSLGLGATQSSPGDHIHDGNSANYLFQNGETIDGKRSDGTALASVIAVLARLGVIDKTTA